MVRIAAVRHEVVATLTARRAAADVDADRNRSTATAFGTVRGMRHYHRPDCRLLAGKQVQFESPDAHAAAGRLPCGICAPTAGHHG
jgi:hypothetical protein